ncbi:hypothetical protein KUTeg_019505 [Tegillarca granosa]|uniref:Uncharacterized protein n=1 Tax=Tegillarca granosa TaxID=220873 RepID=A0ABQ9ECP5_TEGGR|nr:hypothetical protein KUTeg_019505 [Tegillarca granosa]
MEDTTVHDFTTVWMQNSFKFCLVGELNAISNILNFLWNVEQGDPSLGLPADGKWTLFRESCCRSLGDTCSENNKCMDNFASNDKNTKKCGTLRHIGTLHQSYDLKMTCFNTRSQGVSFKIVYFKLFELLT